MNGLEENKETTAPSTIFKTEVQIKDEIKNRMKVFKVEDAEPPDDADKPYGSLPDNIIYSQILVFDHLT